MDIVNTIASKVKLYKKTHGNNPEGILNDFTGGTLTSKSISNESKVFFQCLFSKDHMTESLDR